MSRWASKWTSAIGPCRAAVARSSGSDSEWSPPMTTRWSARPSSSDAADSTAVTAAPMSNGFAAMSPASATWWTDHGSTSRNGW